MNSSCITFSQHCVTVYLCIPQRSQDHSETMVQSSRTRLAHLAVLDRGATFSSEETNSEGLKQGINKEEE